MDLVECEAPLDNSFQKDRLELVNKGSISRRRKPSRSNLKLILSPSNDRQIIDVFHNHQQFHSNGSFIQEKVSSGKSIRESSLDNHQKSVISGQLGKKFTNTHQCSERTVSDNYREVVGSIKQIYSNNNCIDLNGNNERTVSSVNNREKYSSFKQEEKSRNNQQNSKSESKNKLNSKYHSQISVTKSHQTDITRNHQGVTKLSNGHLPNNFNHYCDDDISETQKRPEYKNHYTKLSNGHLSDKYNNYENNGDSKIQKILEDKNQCTILNNGHLAIKSNHYGEHDVSKNQKILEYKNHHKAINNCKLQQTNKIHQNVITFSNHRQIITSAPVPVTRSILANGTNETISSQDYSPKFLTESSLPRTSKEPSLVEEARQFSVEAKLKRKNSDVQGRSAVLIQTWERRTQSELHSKSKKDSKTIPKNRFSENENCDTNSSAMPDSYICTKYKGSLQNGDNLQKGEFVSYVRGLRPDETMLYRVSEDRHRRLPPSNHINGEVTDNGHSAVQEPEWISLSRKLCAKFVEGHIEPNSPDSYPNEEPEGVGENFTSSPPSKQDHPGYISTTNKTETQKRKITSIATSEEATISDEPPWIHLSRKLCNKFIEEHIEYPPITNGHLVEIPELVEPNGDVRIIEKIGKPKGNKSKQKKECEPEWVSLSKKLRAKFIESHIDDPDTIALDNQLNASDPEETASETFSDISQDTANQKEVYSTSMPIECKNYIVKERVVQEDSDLKQNGTHLETVIYEEEEPLIFPRKECCWEYQEMEFDQESNSGNFQELEYDDQPIEEARIHRLSLPQDYSNKSEERVTFANSLFARNTECFNNDVKFAPSSDSSQVFPSSPEQNKLITVQFIAHTKSDQLDDLENEATDLSNNQSTQNEPFFNFSSWEVAHYQGEEVGGLKRSETVPLHKEFRSKSLDNLCDSLAETCLLLEKKRASMCSADNSDLEKKSFSVSEKLANKETNENFVNEMKIDYQPSCDISFTNESNSCDVCTCENRINNSDDSMTCSNNLVFEKEKNVFYDKKETCSSSEDEVFECFPRKRQQPSSASESNRSRKTSTPENLEEEIHFNQSKKNSFSENIQFNQSREMPSPVNDDQVQSSPSRFSSENLKKEMHFSEIHNNEVKTKNNQISKNNKSAKCNGMIPNSVYDAFPNNKTTSPKHSQTNNNLKNNSKEPVKMGMSKWITMSKSEQNISKPEYSNIQSLVQKEQKSPLKASICDMNELKDKRKKNKRRNENENEMDMISKVEDSPKSSQSKNENYHHNNINGRIQNMEEFNISPKNSDLKTKCISLCDISRINNSGHCESTKFRQHESIDDLCSSTQTPNHHSQIEFQHFENDAEIPLCAKLVSNHDKRISKSIPSVSPRHRTDSPCTSDSSHVYEDMFKETPSGPSDSEASWTVLKHNTYYVNGRSPSMNDLDFSDSCSMSVKCDYASSSESSTLQSRHSSYASSSFYVNLRDYDSHMLEPNLSKTKKSNAKTENNRNPPSASKSSPPTPESLRHLFTSPLTSIHAPPHHSSRMLNRIPSDPQSHYYSTAATTSSVFKHGFAPVPAKPKKTERSSSMKIKDIAHGIFLTFKKLQNHSKSSSFPSAERVDVSHLAELKSNSELGKVKKGQKDSKNKKNDRSYWRENGKSEFDSGFLSDVQRAKARRSSSDLTDWKSNSELFHSDKKKGKKKSGSKEKGKKNKSRESEPRTIPTVSRKVQQMADGTLYLVTTVSGDSTMPGVYSDSPDTSSELSSHQSVKNSGESNC